MRRAFFSVRALMGIVLIISMSLVALRFSTPKVAGVVIMLTLFGLGLSILAAVHRREARRAFWIGFALMGWGYVRYSSPAWTFTWAEIEHRAVGNLGGEFDNPHQEPILAHWLPTTAFLEAIRPVIQKSSGSRVSLKRVASFFGYSDSRTAAINAALDRPMDLPFAQPTPFDAIVKHIQESTKSTELPNGVPIYIDPIGLDEAEKSMASTVKINLGGIPLRRSLALLLAQLDLRYWVDDEFLMITAAGGRVGPPNAEAIQSFRRVGHCLFALLFALIGGFASRALYATRPS